MKKLRLETENKKVKNSFGDSNYVLCHLSAVRGKEGYIRAGGGYSDPWTRDGSLNSWKAGNLIVPTIARQTLNILTEVKNDKKYIRSSNLNGHEENRQWWDIMIWTISAWNSYLISGDNKFLLDAFNASFNTYVNFLGARFNEEYNLFEGPAFFQDGIAGYPDSIFDPNRRSSFVLDHPNTDKIMCLSTNAIHYGALLAMDKMQNALLDKKYIEKKVHNFKSDAKKLKSAINEHFWIKDKGTYGYIIHGEGKKKGAIEEFQEGCGLAFCLEFNIPNKSQIKSIIEKYEKFKFGIAAVSPSFKRFEGGENGGRHNVMIWPQVNGLFATACVKKGLYKPFDHEFLAMTELFQNSSGDIREIYHPTTGVAHGGVQDGYDNWPSQHYQTWTATAYFSLLIEGIFGMRFLENGLSFEPYLPEYLGSKIEMQNFKYMNNNISVKLINNGNKIKKMFINGKLTDEHILPRFIDKNVEIKIELE